MMNGPRGAGDFTRDDHERGGRAPAASTVRLVDRFPDGRFDGRHGGVKQQAAQLCRATLRQPSPPGFPS